MENSPPCKVGKLSSLEMYAIAVEKEIIRGLKGSYSYRSNSPRKSLHVTVITKFF